MSKVIFSLFDGSGYAVRDWAEAGYSCFCFNSEEADHGGYNNLRVEHPNITYVNVWIDENFDEKLELLDLPKPDLILAFPPCTDLAVSGARHFKSKALKDPMFQIKAVRTAKVAAYLGYLYECPYLIENPVSVLATKWRKPDFISHPYEYGGYLPEEDKHPNFPEYIKARDAYPKKSCYWIGNDFKIPKKEPVDVELGYSDQYKKLGGKSEKTKIIRSLTPRGIATAIFESNK